MSDEEKRHMSQKTTDSMTTRHIEQKALLKTLTTAHLEQRFVQQRTENVENRQGQSSTGGTVANAGSEQQADSAQKE